MLGKLADLRRRQEQRHILAAAPRTVGEWLDEWMLIKERDGNRPSTLQDYRKLIETMSVPPSASWRSTSCLRPSSAGC